ncbi:MaoC domain protein dehydratase [Sphingobium chlorophenolicum L-1]|uniref:MaoC domain protein dehydratase n=1 Tax=Sphingobium chlorophenolicum L-1 TaxID=690566 RepID=F6F1P8_SPHCR|nr:MaoC family dehydratase [Sphingobium chlorophenolicum]AEG51464.1 MaoC domain protein dehydratase [Sphingobium chlorophenolicum L-1]
MTRTIATPGQFLEMVGEILGPSEPVTITQKMIDQFAEATGDHQWIHVDVDRASREMPGGKTIAHGYLTLSLLAGLQNAIYRVEGVGRAINYGANKLRLIAPVPVGSQVQLTQTISGAERIDGGVKVSIDNLFTIVGQERPVLAVETIGLFFDEPAA